ncbi:MAG: integrase core domain-containing protein [Bacteroidales bacterium]|nr:integrase core domain-containing protein [Bacteroidales bacterium]
MQTKADNLLNPHRHYLSKEAKKRLRWLYVLYDECHNNVTQAANKIGISREWLSKIKSKFENNNKDPRILEPELRAPYDASARNRISREIEDRIVEVRNKYPWGEKKIAKILSRDYGLNVHHSTINRYLHKHGKISMKISERNKRAWQAKTRREEQKEVLSRIRYRPPSKIKDYVPGALIEKDMKLVPKIGSFQNVFEGKYRMKDFFYYQHTMIDSFTRIRALELTKQSNSCETTKAYQKAKERLPFEIACINTDNGSENEKDFSQHLSKNDTVHFYSRASTPTDNPRVERSHLTDEKEHYEQKNICKTFEEQKQTLKDWEYTYNYIRPHQALGYLTPMEFYKLWKNNKEKAYQITEKYTRYLGQQRKRLAKARKIKRKEQIEKLMQFIDAKLNQKIDLNVYKLELIKCELCS